MNSMPNVRSRAAASYRATANPDEGDVLLYTVHRCTESEGGRRLLRAARDAVRKKEVRFTRQQRDVLEGATKKNMPQTLLDVFDKLFG
jgi:hypothetical protein